VEEAAAAELGGTSPAYVTLWLKLWNALAFLAVVLALDRLLRSDPARRARAHLLWSLNPLLLWGLVAGGHIDALAAGAGFLGLVLVAVRRPGDPPGALAGLAAGVLVGAATDIKVTFGVFTLAIAWAARRSPRALAAAAGGGLAVLVPSYLWFGPSALAGIVYRRASATGDNLYQLFSRPMDLGSRPHLLLLVVPLLLAVGALLLRRLPDAFGHLPAIQPALAFSVAWLLVWPFQRPWYDAMAFCLLALYPASRLDWPMLVRLVAGTFYYMPGMPGHLPFGTYYDIAHAEKSLLLPVIRLAVLVAVVALCLTGAWNPRAVSGRTPREHPRAPAARAPADASPEPVSDAAGPQGSSPPDPG
jgi:Glycosyltransferase family 87